MDELALSIAAEKEKIAATLKHCKKHCAANEEHSSN